MPSRHPAVRLLLLALVGLLLLPLAATAPASAASLPSKKKWVSDTVAAASGSRTYLQQRLDALEEGDDPLAITLDIDNTSLASHYDPGKPVVAVLKLATYARNHGVKVFFNTARPEGKVAGAVASLEKAGFPVDGICGRRSGESLAEGKQRCRAEFADQGYRIAVNVGNRSTDFTGGGYDRAYRLPNYGNLLV
ncbi:HAD superfamily, subfamily IIIB (Acid phosphatase) [Nocardioides scoriae]|uniref:HAD superfamily, subfamily IIIB (Acid phosphatase) n=1 Tax=Nocardioides scoriae TaxID=642780 RepID=A0A1H1WI32_9ACTN|nr:HAD family acid phosphatase [Nocardioides scoriae]SDS95936.1 HAD superfamily, subfamily IIIB (Acid phosphatase) [Nocardioides scoriae]